MRAKDLTDLLSRTIPAKLPVLIKGAPGVGKTDLVTQAAIAAGAELILTHPVVSDPTDFKGLPAIVNGKAEFLPFGDLNALVQAKKLTVCFLDDLGQAPAVVQAAAMQLILARRVNGHRVSDKVVFIAATNRREDKAGVTGILEPVKSRFATIIELTVNIEDWTKWALENGVPTEVVAFIRFRPTLLLDENKPTNDIVNRPSPRTVTYVGRLLKAGIDVFEAIAGAVGEGFAAEFIGFLKVWQSLPDIDEILENPTTAPVPSEPAALYAVSTALGTKIGAKTATAIMQYVTRMPDEFTVLTLRDCLRKYPAAANNAAYVSWATKNQAILL